MSTSPSAMSESSASTSLKSCSCGNPSGRRTRCTSWNFVDTRFLQDNGVSPSSHECCIWPLVLGKEWPALQSEVQAPLQLLAGDFQFGPAVLGAAVVRAVFS